MRASPAVLVGIGLVLVGAAFHFGYYAPTAARRAALSAEADRLDAQVEALTRARQALPEAERALAVLRERYARALERTLRAQDLPRAAGLVSRAAAGAGTRPVRVNYAMQATEEAAAGTVRFDVEVEGPYAGVVRFLQILERAFDGAEFGSLAVSPVSSPGPASGQAVAQAPAEANPAGRGAVRASLSFTVPVRLARDPAAEAVAWRALRLPLADEAHALPVPNPFEPARLPVVAGAPRQGAAPQAVALRVTGLARHPRGSVAVLVVEDRSYLVREGERLGALRVLAVRPDGVDVQVDRHRRFVPLGVKP